MIIKILEQALLGFVSSAGFSILLLSPQYGIPLAGLAGMGGWVVYFIAVKLNVSVYLATFFGSFVVACISMVMAKKKKCPATLFNIPGIVPLVPGAASYFMTYNLVIGHYQKAVFYGFRAAGIAVSIAAGLIFFDSVYRFYLKYIMKIKVI